MEGEELISIWLAAVDQVASRDYLPLAELGKLPKGVRGDSSMWAERFLAPGADFHRTPAPAKHGYHLATPDTSDLLRHEYRVEKIDLDIVETASFFLIRVKPAESDFAGMNAAQKRSFVTHAAELILDLQAHRWSFKYPASFDEGARFSSAPDLDPITLPGWEARIDGGVHHGRLFFLGFKKHGQTLGFEDTQTWFDADFRARRP